MLENQDHQLCMRAYGSCPPTLTLGLAMWLTLANGTKENNANWNSKGACALALAPSYGSWSLVEQPCELAWARLLENERHVKRWTVSVGVILNQPTPRWLGRWVLMQVSEPSRRTSQLNIAQITNLWNHELNKWFGSDTKFWISYFVTIDNSYTNSLSFFN